MQTLIIENAPEKVASEIQAEIGPMYQKAVSLCGQAHEIQVTEEQDVSGMALAKESRLALRKLRTTAVKRCTELKADSLAYGRAIDAARRQVEGLFKPAEEHLLMQETFAERMEAESVKKCRAEREAALLKAGGNPDFYAQLEKIPDSEFKNLIEETEARAARQKAEFEERERLEKEAAEKDRLERQRLAKENARLKAEAEERERLAAIERAKLQVVERERQSIAERQQAALDEERRKREALEGKQRAEQAMAEAEAKAKEEAEKAAANAPTADRLNYLKFSVFDDKFKGFSDDVRSKLNALRHQWNNGIQNIIDNL
jgi:hypothetical protein